LEKENEKERRKHFVSQFYLFLRKEEKRIKRVSKVYCVFSELPAIVIT